ncbi:MAG: ankyrin repeat domain-containing protein, partial [Acidobacteria bacterium]|nr:ankyrin repeat domain-containing protein [Acidobacteriota bacterium]
LDECDGVGGHGGRRAQEEDPESGWNALHRALYAGNVAIARLLLRAEQRIMTETPGGAVSSRVGELIKAKDREGNSPFDLYNSTIAARTVDDGLDVNDSDTESVASSLLVLPRWGPRTCARSLTSM